MKKQLSALAVILGLAAFSSAQENFTTWTQHRTLVLNTKASGGNVAGDVVNFPTLVRLGVADSVVFSQALAGGADLRFSKSNNTTRLAYQIESWNSAARSAAIWVKLDTVKGNANTLLRMHWGKAGSADSSSGPAVFDTANGFVAVWHFNETPGSPMLDATGKGNTATPSGTSASFPTDTTGVMGAAKYFTKASQQFYSIANGGANIGLNSDNGPYTITAWVNPGPTCGVSSGTNNDNRITVISKYGAVGAGNSEYAIQGVGTTWRLQNTPASLAAGSNSEYFADKPCTANTWQLVESQYYSDVAPTANTAGANKMQVRVDNGDSTLGGPGAGRNGTGSPVYIGKMSDNYRFMGGAIDQIVISKVLRSADWKKLVYETEKPGQTVVATLTAPTGFHYSSDTVVYQAGLAIAPNTVTLTGVVDSFTVAPALPTGLVLNKTTGAITGTPTVLTAVANYVLTAINASGTAKDTLRLSVVSAPPAINYVASVSFLAGASIVPITPALTGAVDSFTVAPALPTGLVLNKTTGVISGVPAAAVAATNYVITATNYSGTSKDTLSVTIVASEDYTGGWNRHKTLWLNTTVSGAAVNGTVTNFPVLVRFAATDTVYAQMLSGAADLRFTKANNTTRLPHQIELWDSAGKSAAVWVLMDTVLGNSHAQSIRMHWGKAGAQDLSLGNAVFSNGFTNVWHLGNAVGVTARPNAIIGGNAATPVNFPVSYAAPAGIIGKGEYLRGGPGYSAGNATASNKNDYISLGTITSDYSQGFTFSAWVKPDVLGSNTVYYTASEAANGTATSGIMVVGSQGADGTLGAKVRQRNAGSGSNSGILNTDGALSGTLGTWSHILATLNATGDMAMYLNGTVIGTANSLSAYSSVTRPINNLGTSLAHLQYADSSFHGTMDEARLANVGRSADWVKLEYQNQREGQTFVADTLPVVSIGQPIKTAFREGLTASAEGHGIVFQVAGVVQGGKITLMDMYGRTVWNSTFPAGSNRIRWNGIAGNGQAVSAGIYLARVTLPGSAGRLEIKVSFAP